MEISRLLDEVQNTVYKYINKLSEDFNIIKMDMKVIKENWSEIKDTLA